MELDFGSESEIEMDQPQMQPSQPFQEQHIENLIGWDALLYGTSRSTERHLKKLKKDCYHDSEIDSSFSSYKITGSLNIKAEYILVSSKSNQTYKFDKRNTEYERLLIETAERWKCKNVLDKICKKHRCETHRLRRAAQTGEGLKYCKKVVNIAQLGKFGIGTVFNIVERFEENGSFSFDIYEPSSETFLRHVPRSSITSFYIKDSKIFDDILNYRKNYRCVVDELQEKFDDAYSSNTIVFDS